MSTKTKDVCMDVIKSIDSSIDLIKDSKEKASPLVKGYLEEFFVGLQNVYIKFTKKLENSGILESKNRCNEDKENILTEEQWKIVLDVRAQLIENGKYEKSSKEEPNTDTQSETEEVE